MQRFQVDAERAHARGGVHRAQHRRDARGLRRRRRRGGAVQRDDGCRARRTARGRRDDREHPHHRPRARRRRPSPSSSSSSSTTSSPTHLDVDRYKIDGTDAGHGHRGARAQPGRPRRLADAGTTTPRLHARLRRRRRLRQPARGRRPARVPRVGHPERRVRSATFEPRIYFGEESPDVLDRRRPRGRDDDRARLPVGRRRQRRSNATTTFTGNGGPKLDNVFKKLIYAIKFQSEQIFLSDAVNDQSQILYDRDPKERVAEGRAVPDARQRRRTRRSSTARSSGSSTATRRARTTRTRRSSSSPTRSPTRTRRSPAFAVDDINYIRNSVKATVDAYDGKVTLYAWDDKDPVLKTWQKIFPSTLKPMSDMSARAARATCATRPTCSRCSARSSARTT